MDRRTCTIGTKNPGRCGEVATIERWPLVEVRLYELSERTALLMATLTKPHLNSSLYNICITHYILP